MRTTELLGTTEIKFSFGRILRALHNHKIFRPANFSHQWCEFFILAIGGGQQETFDQTLVRVQRLEQGCPRVTSTNFRDLRELENWRIGRGTDSARNRQEQRRTGMAADSEDGHPDARS